jgi:hypothetical protein
MTANQRDDEIGDLERAARDADLELSAAYRRAYRALVAAVEVGHITTECHLAVEAVQRATRAHEDVMDMLSSLEEEEDVAW